MPASGDAVSATIADTSAAGNISINSAFGIISGGANGIVASSAGSGSITITAASVTGTTGDGIYVGLANAPRPVLSPSPLPEWFREEPLASLPAMRAVERRVLLPFLSRRMPESVFGLAQEPGQASQSMPGARSLAAQG